MVQMPPSVPVQFAPRAAELLRADARRIVIVGAGGWIGRTLLELLHAAPGSQDLVRRIHAFGSGARDIVLDDGTRCPQRPLADLAALPAAPTVLFHLAFLTKDRVSSMDPDAYCAANRALSAVVHAALDPIGVDRLFVASSGAAAFVDAPEAATDLRLYGSLKREDEARFSAWARQRPDVRRAAIGRIHAVSGPWMNKHGTYALASFILAALAGKPIEVRAPHPVLRSYVAVREMLSLVVAMLLSPQGTAVQHFATGGETLELAEVAATVAQVLGGTVWRGPLTAAGADDYTGEAAAWNRLLADYGMIHLPLAAQIAETAAWLATFDGPGRPSPLESGQLLGVGTE